jgi:enoyl-[acyl-carrier protein] reductase I
MRIQSLGKQERIYEEGGVFVLTNAPASIRMGSIELAQKTGSTIIPADATSVTDLENLVDQAVAILGGKIDFVLHSIGMSVNVRKEIIILIRITSIPKGMECVSCFFS